MDLDTLFPGMANPVGALLPGLISLAIVLSGRAGSGLKRSDQFWLIAFSMALSVALARVSITPEETALYIPPGATLLVGYLVWSGHYISPGLAFVLTYVTLLPVDYFLARMLIGAEFDPACIGGAGWCDGLLVLPALTALAVVYANWRMRSVGRARLVWSNPAAPLAIFRGMDALPQRREGKHENGHVFAIPPACFLVHGGNGEHVSDRLRRGRR